MNRAILDIHDHGKVLIACRPVSPKWRYLAARLGVLENPLAIIEADYRQEGVERCMSAVIDKWLRRPVGEVADDGVLPSWRNLCVALSPIDGVLAEGIAMEHGCTIISPTVSEITKQSNVAPAFLSYSCGCGRCAVSGWMTCQTMCLYAVTQPKLWIIEPQFVQFDSIENHYTRQLRLCHETNSIANRFRLLSSNTWNLFSRLLGNDIKHVDVAFALGSELRIIIPDLSDIIKIQNFVHSHNVVNWFSFGLLYFLYSTFLRERSPDITAEWNTYLSQFKDYCSARNIKDFIGIFFEVEDNNIFLIEIDERYYNFTLADVDSLRESLSIALDVPAVSLHLVTVKTGSVIIYFYYCYSDYLTRFMSLSSQQLKKIAIIKPHRILSLTDLYHQFEYDKIQNYYNYEDSSSSTTTELQLWKKQAHVKDIDLSKKEAEIGLLKDQLEKNKDLAKVEVMELRDTISNKEDQLQKYHLKATAEIMEMKDTISKKEAIIQQLMIQHTELEALYREWKYKEYKPVRIITDVVRPWKLAVFDNGDIVVAEWDNNCVTIISKEEKGTVTEKRRIRQFDNPRGVAITKDGHLLVTDEHRIQKLTIDGVCLKSVGSWGLQFDHPVGITIHPITGQIFVADIYNNRIQVLNDDLTFSHMISLHGDKQLNRPYEVALDNDGYLYIVEWGNDCITKVTTTGEYITRIGSIGSGPGQLWSPTSVAISNNILYVTEVSNNRVSIFDINGQFLRSFTGTTSGKEFKYPYGIAIDTIGNLLYVSDTYNNRIVVYGL